MTDAPTRKDLAFAADLAQAKLEVLLAKARLNDHPSSDPAITTAASTTADPVTDADPDYDVTVIIPIAKIDSEERLVTGIVLEPDEVDSQGDTISTEEIRAAAHRFLRRFNAGTQLGVMHKMFGDIGIDLVESYIAISDFTLSEESVKAGSWLITVHIVSDKIWKDIKTGKLTGFSIGGVATVDPV